MKCGACGGTPMWHIVCSPAEGVIRPCPLSTVLVGVTLLPLGECILPVFMERPLLWEQPVSLMSPWQLAPGFWPDHSAGTPGLYQRICPGSSEKGDACQPRVHHCRICESMGSLPGTLCSSPQGVSSNDKSSSQEERASFSPITGLMLVARDTMASSPPTS